MRKLVYLALIIVAIIFAKRGIDWLGQKAHEEDPVTQTINRIDWTKEKVTGLDTHFIQTQITAFITTYDRRPKSLQEMVDLNFLTGKNIEDPWGNNYSEEWTDKQLIL